jgi:NitT/TauT family transport system substrate-binding protein
LTTTVYATLIINYYNQSIVNSQSDVPNKSGQALGTSTNMNKQLLPLILIITALLVGCTPKQEVESVSLQLSWIHEYSSSMFPAADAEGFFADNFIDVNVIEGGFGENGFVDSVATVVDGTSEFGVTDGFRLLEARNQGHPLVAIASVLQRSPNAIISLTDQNIIRPQDLVGHSVLVADGGANLLFAALLESQGVNPDDIEIVSRTEFGVEPVLNGNADSVMGWIINESVLIEEAGATPNNILFSDYGIDNYNFVLFTTEDMIANRPETVQHMVTGLLQGVQFVVSNPEKAIEHTLAIAPELNAEDQLRRLQAAIPLLNVPGVPIGSMDPEIWEFTADLLKTQGAIDEDFDVTQAYTLQFVTSGE